MKKQLNKKGFTLIEVVLVLAIGGLIFLLAFLAFQQVSRNRRDTQRRSDAGRILAEIDNFKGDTKGTVITTAVSGGTSSPNTGICSDDDANIAKGFTRTYLCKDGKFLSPAGTNYNTAAYNSGVAPAKDEVKIQTTFTFGATVVAKACDNTTDLAQGQYRVEIGLESGSVCRDSR